MNRHLRLVAASTFLFAAAAPLPAQSVRAGIEAWQRADYASAVAIWRPLAEKGDADAAFNLGQAYRLGRGVQTNLAAAKTWFERSASKGHVDAQTTLGLLLFENGDHKEGLPWLKAAAEQGEARALLVYGTALFNGDGVTQDPVLGYAYVSRSAAQGFAPAKDTLAQLDRIMPLADRKKGVALARIKARRAPPPVSRPVKSAPVAAASATNKAKAPPPPAPAKPTAVSSPPFPARGAAQAQEATGGWRIQLGAFAQRGSAEALYQRVAGKSALAGRRAYYVAAGKVTRLQAGPFASRAAAQAACNALKPQACFPAPAK